MANIISTPKNPLKPCLLSIKRNSTPRSPRPSNTRAQRFLQFRSSSLIAEPDQSIIYLDLSGFSWETIFQDVVRRSKTLEYISVISSFTCSKMYSDGFGGMAVVVTGTAIRGKSTEDILEELLEEEEAGPFAPVASAAGDHANV